VRIESKEIAKRLHSDDGAGDGIIFRNRILEKTLQGFPGTAAEGGKKLPVVTTLKEANSWGKVDATFEQMVYAEATTVLPLLASYAYHKGNWKKRKKWQLAKIFDVR